MTGSACTVLPGFPIRTSRDQSLFDGSPGLIAAYHVLHRLITPRHPPCTLRGLATSAVCPHGPNGRCHQDRQRTRTSMNVAARHRPDRPEATPAVTPHDPMNLPNNCYHRPALSAARVPPHLLYAAGAQRTEDFSNFSRSPQILFPLFLFFSSPRAHHGPNALPSKHLQPAMRLAPGDDRARTGNL